MEKLLLRRNLSRMLLQVLMFNSFAHNDQFNIENLPYYSGQVYVLNENLHSIYIQLYALCLPIQRLTKGFLQQKKSYGFTLENVCFTNNNFIFLQQLGIGC